MVGPVDVKVAYSFAMRSVPRTLLFRTHLEAHALVSSPA